MGYFDWLTKPLETPKGRVGLGEDPLVKGLGGWANDRAQDVGTKFGIHTSGNYRDPYVRAQEAAKGGDLDELQSALQEAGTGNTSEERRTLAGLRNQAQGLASQRADQQFDKQANRLYGDNGLITNLETRRAAQNLASQRILGEMQSKSQLASEGLRNQGQLGSAAISAQGQLGSTAIASQGQLGSAAINAAAQLQGQDIQGMWGFKDTLARSRSAENVADITSGRQLAANLDQNNMYREANLLDYKNKQAAMVHDSYTKNYATTTQALSNANGKGSFQNSVFKF